MQLFFPRTFMTVRSRKIHEFEEGEHIFKQADGWKQLWGCLY